LGDVDWTPVDSLTAQKRLIEAGLGIALLSQSNVADELRSRAISTIDVGDLAASHNIVAVTRRGGFLSAASRRLLEIIRTHYIVDKIVRRKGAGKSGSGFSPKRRAGLPGRPRSA
jgi:DNA-binding transcriptional LysR family regulator